MSKSLELIKKRKEQYREMKQRIKNDIDVARKLDFQAQVKQSQDNYKWAVEVIDLLEEIAVQVQAENK